MAELNEFFFSEANDKEELKGIFLKLFKQKTFVPFFGLRDN